MTRVGVKVGMTMVGVKIGMTRVGVKVGMTRLENRNDKGWSKSRNDKGWSKSRNDNGWNKTVSVTEPRGILAQTRGHWGGLSSGLPRARPCLQNSGRNYARLCCSGDVHSGIAAEGEEIACRRGIGFHVNTGADVEGVVIGGTAGSDNHPAQAGHPGAVAERPWPTRTEASIDIDHRSGKGVVR